MSGRVRVELRRSGGIAGRRVHVVVDSARLPPAEAAELVRLVSVVDLGGLRSGGKAHGADLMRYDLIIECGARRWEGVVSDPSVPAALRPLLQFLSRYV